MSIKPGDKPINAGITGLWLYPSKTTKGTGKWIFRFTSPQTGKRRDMGLGVYPDVPLADAFEKARTARATLAKGIDPLGERKALQAMPTFEQAARERHTLVAPTFKNEKHRAQWITTLETYVFPKLGSAKVDSLTPQHFADTLKPIWTAKPETARRVKMRCNDVMKSCVAAGWIQSNPVDVVAQLLPSNSAKGEKAHLPAMPWPALPDFVGQYLSNPTGAKAALLFAILTAARSGEVLGAVWGEIDLESKVWTIPSDRMKAGRTHRVPLPDAAVRLLQSIKPDTSAPIDLVFKAAKGKQYSDMALTKVLRDIDPPLESDVPGRIPTVHGFRASFRNWCADSGIDTDTAERCLAHTIKNQTQAAYERTDRFEIRAQVMRGWADHVTGKTAAANVLQLRRAGA